MIASKKSSNMDQRDEKSKKTLIEINSEYPIKTDSINKNQN